MTPSLSQTENMPCKLVKAECPSCGLQVSDTNGVSLFFGWRTSYRTTKEPTIFVFPQSWCIKCRSKRRIRYE